MLSKSIKASSAIGKKLWPFQNRNILQPSSRCLHATKTSRSESNNDQNPFKPVDFQSELDGVSYCPPLAQPLPPKPYHHPITRTLNVMGITGRNDPKTQERIAFPNHCDVVIIGGGIMGCSIAYWLKRRSPTGLNIVVVERDPTYSRASTVLSVGGLRQQFSLAENIEMSLFGADFLRESKQLLSIDEKEAPDVQFHPHGYLYLSTIAGAEQLMANHKLQT